MMKLLIFAATAALVALPAFTSAGSDECEEVEWAKLDEEFTRIRQPLPSWDIVETFDFEWADFSGFTISSVYNSTTCPKLISSPDGKAMCRDYTANYDLLEEETSSDSFYPSAGGKFTWACEASDECGVKHPINMVANVRCDAPPTLKAKIVYPEDYYREGHKVDPNNMLLGQYVIIDLTDSTDPNQEDLEASYCLMSAPSVNGHNLEEFPLSVISRKQSNSLQALVMPRHVGTGTYTIRVQLTDGCNYVETTMRLTFTVRSHVVGSRAIAQAKYPMVEMFHNGDGEVYNYSTYVTLSGEESRVLYPLHQGHNYNNDYRRRLDRGSDLPMTWELVGCQRSAGDGMRTCSRENTIVVRTSDCDYYIYIFDAPLPALVPPAPLEVERRDFHDEKNVHHDYESHSRIIKLDSLLGDDHTNRPSTYFDVLVNYAIRTNRTADIDSLIPPEDQEYDPRDMPDHLACMITITDSGSEEPEVEFRAVDEGYAHWNYTHAAHRCWGDYTFRLHVKDSRDWANTTWNTDDVNVTVGCREHHPFLMPDVFGVFDDDFDFAGGSRTIEIDFRLLYTGWSDPLITPDTWRRYEPVVADKQVSRLYYRGATAYGPWEGDGEQNLEDYPLDDFREWEFEDGDADMTVNFIPNLPGTYTIHIVDEESTCPERPVAITTVYATCRKLSFRDGFDLNTFITFDVEENYLHFPEPLEQIEFLGNKETSLSWAFRIVDRPVSPFFDVVPQKDVNDTDFECFLEPDWSTAVPGEGGSFNPRRLVPMFDRQFYLEPRVHGTYEIELFVTDGCTAITETATITTYCNSSRFLPDEPTVDFSRADIHLASDDHIELPGVIGDDILLRWNGSLVEDVPGLIEYTDGDAEYLFVLTAAPAGADVEVYRPVTDSQHASCDHFDIHEDLPDFYSFDGVQDSTDELAGEPDSYRELSLGWDADDVVAGTYTFAVVVMSDCDMFHVATFDVTLTDPEPDDGPGGPGGPDLPDCPTELDQNPRFLCANSTLHLHDCEEAPPEGLVFTNLTGIFPSTLTLPCNGLAMGRLQAVFDAGADNNAPYVMSLSMTSYPAGFDPSFFEFSEPDQDLDDSDQYLEVYEQVTDRTFYMVTYPFFTPVPGTYEFELSLSYDGDEDDCVNPHVVTQTHTLTVTKGFSCSDTLDFFTTTTVANKNPSLVWEGRGKDYESYALSFLRPTERMQHEVDETAFSVSDGSNCFYADDDDTVVQCDIPWSENEAAYAVYQLPKVNGYTGDYKLALHTVVDVYVWCDAELILVQPQIASQDNSHISSSRQHLVPRMIIPGSCTELRFEIPPARLVGRPRSYRAAFPSFVVENLDQGDDSFIAIFDVWQAATPNDPMCDRHVEVYTEDGEVFPDWDDDSADNYFDFNWDWLPEENRNNATVMTKLESPYLEDDETSRLALINITLSYEFEAIVGGSDFCTFDIVSRPVRTCPNLQSGFAFTEPEQLNYRFGATRILVDMPNAMDLYFEKSKRFVSDIHIDSIEITAAPNASIYSFYGFREMLAREEGKVLLDERMVTREEYESLFNDRRRLDITNPRPNEAYDESIDYFRLSLGIELLEDEFVVKIPTSAQLLDGSDIDAAETYVTYSDSGEVSEEEAFAVILLKMRQNAAYVPDVSGVYEFETSWSDGCQTRTITGSLNVTCTPPVITVPQPVITVTNLDPVDLQALWDGSPKLPQYASVSWRLKSATLARGYGEEESALENEFDEHINIVYGDTLSPVAMIDQAGTYVLEVSAVTSCNDPAVTRATVTIQVSCPAPDLAALYEDMFKHYCLNCIHLPDTDMDEELEVPEYINCEMRLERLTQECLNPWDITVNRVYPSILPYDIDRRIELVVAVNGKTELPAGIRAKDIQVVVSEYHVTCDDCNENRRLDHDRDPVCQELKIIDASKGQISCIAPARSADNYDVAVYIAGVRSRPTGLSQIIVSRGQLLPDGAGVMYSLSSTGARLRLRGYALGCDNVLCPGSSWRKPDLEDELEVEVSQGDYEFRCINEAYDYLETAMFKEPVIDIVCTIPAVALTQINLKEEISIDISTPFTSSDISTTVTPRQVLASAADAEISDFEDFLGQERVSVSSGAFSMTMALPTMLALFIAVAVGLRRRVD